MNYRHAGGTVEGRDPTIRYRVATRFALDEKIVLAEETVHNNGRPAAAAPARRRPEETTR
jgi:hypothetical protein